MRRFAARGGIETRPLSAHKNKMAFFMQKGEGLFSLASDGLSGRLPL